MKNTEHLNKDIDRRIPNARPIILDFVLTFSRMECALKNTPNFLAGNDHGAEPNWDVFLMSINEKFNPNTEALKESVQYILDLPPRKQVNNDGILNWNDALLDANAAQTLKLGTYIRRIRNNLMHGGKFSGNYEPESRNFQLLTHALRIMNYMIDLDEDLRGNFRKGIEP